MGPVCAPLCHKILAAVTKFQKPFPKKILVVGDDPEILNTINLMLGLEGYDIEILSDGKPIMKNQAIVPDLYIIDKVAPSADGVDICHSIKSNEKTKSIPVFMISATDSKSEALAAGADHFIQKPFMMYTFLNHIAALLKVPPQNEWVKA
jgi:DNA-binding response OmpR family regulator